MVPVEFIMTARPAPSLTGGVLALALALASPVAATAETAAVMVAQAAAANPAFANVAEQLAADRAYVTNVLAEQQQRLEDLLAASRAMPGAAAQPGAPSGVFALNIDVFAEFQRQLMADYSEFVRLRTAGVFAGLDAHTDAATDQFVQTGFVFEAATPLVELPEVPSNIPVPDANAPFPGLSVPGGGFFASVGQ